MDRAKRSLIAVLAVVAVLLVLVAASASLDCAEPQAESLGELPKLPASNVYAEVAAKATEAVDSYLVLLGMSGVESRPEEREEFFEAYRERSELLSQLVEEVDAVVRAAIVNRTPILLENLDSTEHLSWESLNSCAGLVNGVCEYHCVAGDIGATVRYSIIGLLLAHHPLMECWSIVDSSWAQTQHDRSTATLIEAVSLCDDRRLLRWALSEIEALPQGVLRDYALRHEYELHVQGVASMKGTTVEEWLFRPNCTLETILRCLRPFQELMNDHTYERVLRLIAEQPAGGLFDAMSERALDLNTHALHWRSFCWFQVHTQRDALRVLVAVRLFFLREDRFPKSIDELVPSCLDAVLAGRYGAAPSLAQGGSAVIFSHRAAEFGVKPGLRPRVRWALKGVED